MFFVGVVRISLTDQSLILIESLPALTISNHSGSLEEEYITSFIKTVFDAKPG